MLSTVLRKDPALGEIAESLRKESLALGTMSSYAGPNEKFKIFCQEQHLKPGFFVQNTLDRNQLNVFKQRMAMENS